MNDFVRFYNFFQDVSYFVYYLKLVSGPILKNEGGQNQMFDSIQELFFEPESKIEEIEKMKKYPCNICNEMFEDKNSITLHQIQIHLQQDSKPEVHKMPMNNK